MTTKKSHFLKTEAGAGAILALAAALGLLAANSPAAPYYFGALHLQASLAIGDWRESHHLLDWIKEGLLAIFFFAVGLEIKFEILRGELSSPKRLALPLIAAAGGMLVPALVYLAVNALPGGQPRGWPVPLATDIVFALAALAAVGRRAPPSLRSFLLALAVVDDLGAVILIAILFTGQLSLPMMAGAGATLAAMGLLSFWRRAPAALYAAGALGVWAFTLKSGVATSVGAVAAALMVPVGQSRPGAPGMAHAMLDALRPYVSYLILPIFAFAASGFSLAAMGLEEFASPAGAGVFFGLVAGKPVGVLGASALAVALGFAHKPAGAGWRQLAAAAMLCGVGFTMSLYLAGLAFGEDGLSASSAKGGVILASLVATCAGVLLLMRRVPPSPPGAGS